MGKDNTTIPAVPREDTAEVTLGVDGALRLLFGRASIGNQGPADELDQRYEFSGSLGRGGMGVVTEVKDRRLQRSVAMKTLAIDAAAGDHVHRFVLEAQVTSQLDHPNIPPVHDLGVGPDGSLYFTMKRVTGVTLSRMLKEQSPSLVRRLDIFLKVCDAVAYAHSQGVLHRDLKPSNVMLGEFREVWVLDWGLAKVVGTDDSSPSPSISGDGPTDSSLTRAGSVMGTPAFMSPEQARGDHHLVDERSDVYMLGTMLYYMLVGTAPFRGKGGEVLTAVRAGDFVAPRRAASDVPWELDAVVRRAMSTEPADRYADVESLREDVQAFLEGRPLASVRYSMAHRLSKWASRHRRVVVPSVLVAAAGALVAIAVLTLYVANVAVARDRALEAERQAGLALADNYVALARARAQMGRVDDALEYLPLAKALYTEHGERPLKAVLASSVIHHQYPPALLTWETGDPTNALSGGLFSADSERLAIRGDDGTRLYSLPLGSQIPLQLPEEEVYSTYFVGDRLVASVWNPDEIRFVDLEDGTALGRVPGPASLDGLRTFLAADGTIGLVSDPYTGTHAFHMDGTSAGPDLPDLWMLGHDRAGRWLFGLEPGGSPHRSVDAHVIYDRVSGERLVEIPNSADGALSDDGTLCSVKLDGELAIFGLREDGLHEKWRIPFETGWRFWFDEAGERLMTSRPDHTLAIYEADSGALVSEGRIGGNSSSSRGAVRVSPNGELLFTVLDQRAQLWALDSGTIGKLGFRASDEALTTMALSADGRLLATGGRATHSRVWDWRSETLLYEQEGLTDGIRDLNFSADGTQLATAGRDGLTRLIDIGTGSVVGSFGEAGADIAMAVAFVGDELWVAYAAGRVVIYDVRTGVVRDTIDTGVGSLWGMTVSPDQRVMVNTGRASTDPLVETWDVATRSHLATSETLAVGYRVAFTADSTVFAVGNQSGKPHIWRADGVAPDRIVEGLGEVAMSTGFSDDGALMAFGQYNGTLTVVDLSTWEEVVSVQLHERAIVDLDFVPDTHVVISASGDGTVVTLDLGLADHFGGHPVLPMETGRQPETAATWLTVARAAEFEQRWPAALYALERAIRAGATVDHERLGRALWKNGRLLEARETLGPVDKNPAIKLWIGAMKTSDKP